MVQRYRKRTSQPELCPDVAMHGVRGAKVVKQKTSAMRGRQDCA